MVEVAASKIRYLGLDLIRFISFLAIAVFHISVIHFHSETLSISERSWVIYTIDTLARSISFSGFTVLLLSSLLTGFSNSSVIKRIWIFVFLFIGWVSLCFLISAPLNFFRTWDIYLLIFLGFLSASLCEMFSRKMLTILMWVGFVLMWIPIWDLGDYFEDSLGLSIAWQSILGFANCKISYSEWPILPWIGFIWFGYGLGFELKKIVREGRTKELDLTKKEMALWVFLLAISIPQWGAFFNIRLVEFFRCQAYKMPPIIFWSHLIWPIFLMRISLSANVQETLARYRFFRWLSQLAISKHFWLAYATHYVLALALSNLVNVSGIPETEYYDAVVIFIAFAFVPLTEISMRVMKFLTVIGYKKAVLLRNSRNQAGKS